MFWAVRVPSESATTNVTRKTKNTNDISIGSPSRSNSRQQRYHNAEKVLKGAPNQVLQRNYRARRCLAGSLSLLLNLWLFRDVGNRGDGSRFLKFVSFDMKRIRLLPLPDERSLWQMSFLSEHAYSAMRMTHPYGH